MPLEVAIPYHLADDYEELSKQYSRMKLSWAASSELFNTLTSTEKALILPLQKHVFRTVRNAVRQQAGRCLGRALSDLIELHYPYFFTNVLTHPKHKQKKQRGDATPWKYAYFGVAEDTLEAFPSSGLPFLPARITLFGELQVALRLKDRWLPRIVKDCADFS